MQFIRLSKKMPSPLGDERSYDIFAVFIAPFSYNFVILTSQIVTKLKFPWDLADPAGLAQCFYCKARVVMKVSS
jgi:hypothetical protein